MHGALAEGKKSWNYFCNLFPQSLPALIEEIHNAVIGFCRELPNILFKPGFKEVGKPPDLWWPSFPESLQSKSHGRKWRKRVSSHLCSLGRN